MTRLRHGAGVGVGMSRRRKTNRALLIERLTTSYVDRVRPRIKRTKDGKPKYETAHFAGMAQRFGSELLALAAGADECGSHPDQVAGDCPYCRGIWSSDGDDPEEGAALEEPG